MAIGSISFEFRKSIWLIRRSCIDNLLKDVYKRQQLGIRMIGVIQHLELGSRDIDGFQHFVAVLVPVSYTHLDVYKRQNHTLMNEVCQESIIHLLHIAHKTIIHLPVSYTHLDVYKRQGENPRVLFKTYKLNRAAKLIKEGKYTISEIADMTGFSTLSHFSTSFKKMCIRDRW